MARDSRKGIDSPLPGFSFAVSFDGLEIQLFHLAARKGANGRGEEVVIHSAGIMMGPCCRGFDVLPHLLGFRKEEVGLRHGRSSAEQAYGATTSFRMASATWAGDMSIFW